MEAFDGSRKVSLGISREAQLQMSVCFARGCTALVVWGEEGGRPGALLAPEYFEILFRADALVETRGENLHEVDHGGK
jgi:hypothetical protein